MRELEIAESIARDIAIEKRARLDTLIDEIAGANFFDTIEDRASFRARAIEALDRGELEI